MMCVQMLLLQQASRPASFTFVVRVSSILVTLAERVCAPYTDDFEPCRFQIIMRLGSARILYSSAASTPEIEPSSTRWFSIFCV